MKAKAEQAEIPLAQEAASPTQAPTTTTPPASEGAGGAPSMAAFWKAFAAAQAEIDRQARIAFARGFVVRPTGLGANAPLVGAAAVARRHLN